jgi:hypothetical protein
MLMRANVMRVCVCDCITRPAVCLTQKEIETHTRKLTRLMGHFRSHTAQRPLDIQVVDIVNVCNRFVDYFAW